MHQHSQDAHFMQEALKLGTRALGRTAPNPSVGAVIVRNAEVVGRGWTQPTGDSHAEIVALRDAGGSKQGATLYVTLEPCCHHGRTPPCTDAIIRAGITRCVVAVEDPHPSVAGQGIARLGSAGITVDVGICESEAVELHAGYLSRIRTGRPCVLAKYAMTLDGRIATRTGNSKWITGPTARRHAHVMRDRTDAILVGAGTVRIDDPWLTTRLPTELIAEGGVHHPLRIVVDGQGTSSPSATIFDPSLPGQTLVATTASATPLWLDELRARGVEHLVCGDGPRVNLQQLLQKLGRRGINDLLVEGGGSILGSFFDAGLVDRVAVFVAPVIVGGVAAPGPVGGRGCEFLAESWRLRDVRLTVLDGDVLLEGAVAPSHTTGGVA